ncbi:MAG: hypothetical protein KF876_14120, partial [Nitrospira sp.]|nr:hypothetical protein [Nitrospira sp.]
MIIPVAMATVLGLASLAFYNESDQTVPMMIWSFGILIPDFMVLTWFAVACHRLILIGEGAVSEFGLTRWTWRETRFFLWMLLAYIIGCLFMLLGDTALFAVAFLIANACGFSTKTTSLMMEHPAFFPGVFLLASIPFAYVVGRMSILLPATAIDLRPSFFSAWDLSEGNGWRVAILVGGIPLAFIAIQSFIWMIPSWVFGVSPQGAQSALDVTSVGLTLMQSILRYIFATAEIAILSITFRRLRAMEEQKLVLP